MVCLCTAIGGIHYDGVCMMAVLHKVLFAEGFSSDLAEVSPSLPAKFSAVSPSTPNDFIVKGTKK